MINSGYFHFVAFYPLSRFPQGGKALHGAPSPLGEGWEGGHKYLSNCCFIQDYRYSIKRKY